MWKRDAKKEAEARSQQARCCAQGRDEWRQRARNRGLIPQKTKSWRSSQWMRRLEYKLSKTARSLAIRDDGNNSIDPGYESHFLRLPLELREHIYRYYVLDWSSARLEHWGRRDPGEPIPPHEPPITQVSRLIRMESLRVFYRSARFPLIIHLEKNSTIIGPPYSAVDWYEHLGPSKLCLIRHLELYLCLRNTIHARRRNPFVFNVDFEPHGNRVYWAYMHLLYLSFSIADGEALVAPHEEDLLNKTLQKFQCVAQSLGSAGIVTARDIYKFIE